jgi:hypothetical protein
MCEMRPQQPSKNSQPKNIHKSYIHGSQWYRKRIAPSLIAQDAKTGALSQTIKRASILQCNKDIDRVLRSKLDSSSQRPAFYGVHCGGAAK